MSGRGKSDTRSSSTKKKRAVSILEDFLSTRKNEKSIVGKRKSAYRRDVENDDVTTRTVRLVYHPTTTRMTTTRTTRRRNTRKRRKKKKTTLTTRMIHCSNHLVRRRGRDHR